MTSKKRAVQQMIAIILLFSMTTWICPVSALASQEGERSTAIDDLGEAQRLYEYANYQAALAKVDRVIALAKVEELIEKGVLDPAELHKAYILKGRCLVEMNRLDEAESAFCEAIKLDRDWRPDPFEFKSAELEAFSNAAEDCLIAPPPVTRPGREVEPRAGEASQVQQREEQKGKGPLTYILIGGAALAAGIVALVLAGGGDEGKEPPAGNGELPDFPDPPGE